MAGQVGGVSGWACARGRREAGLKSVSAERGQDSVSWCSLGLWGVGAWGPGATPVPRVDPCGRSASLWVFGLDLRAVVDFAVNIFKDFFKMGKLNQAK